MAFSFNKRAFLNCEIITRRLISWEELEALQESLKAKVLENRNQVYFLLSEPLPTFTFGKQADPSDLLWTPELLEANQVKVAQVDRGGQWTYHGPGQLLCYPIASLETLGFGSKSARSFVDLLRTSVQKACAEMGCLSQPEDEPFGLFVGNQKLASFGMSFQGGVSSHGVALYVTPQKFFFEGIHPCGQKRFQATSLQENIPHLSWSDAAASLIRFLEKGFKIS